MGQISEENLALLKANMIEINDIRHKLNVSKEAYNVIKKDIELKQLEIDSIRSTADKLFKDFNIYYNQVMNDLNTNVTFLKKVKATLKTTVQTKANKVYEEISDTVAGYNKYIDEFFNSITIENYMFRPYQIKTLDQVRDQFPDYFKYRGNLISKTPAREFFETDLALLIAQAEQMESMVEDEIRPLIRKKEDFVLFLDSFDEAVDKNTSHGGKLSYEEARLNNSLDKYEANGKEQIQKLSNFIEIFKSSARNISTFFEGDPETIILQINRLKFLVYLKMLILPWEVEIPEVTPIPKEILDHMEYLQKENNSTVSSMYDIALSKEIIKERQEELLILSENIFSFEDRFKFLCEQNLAILGCITNSDASLEASVTVSNQEVL